MALEMAPLKDLNVSGSIIFLRNIIGVATSEKLPPEVKQSEMAEMSPVGTEVSNTLYQGHAFFLAVKKSSLGLYWNFFRLEEDSVTLAVCVVGWSIQASSRPDTLPFSSSTWMRASNSRNSLMAFI